MKRKKVMTITALVFTCATIASCGKTTETVNAEPVIQATEQIVLETEEITQVSADQGEGEDIALEPTMVDGRLVYPTYEEKYVQYTELTPSVELYCIEHSTHFDNPNMTKGVIVNGGGFSQVGDKLTFDATCEIDGVKYYRFTADDNRCYILKAECWSETPPSDANTASTDGGFEEAKPGDPEWEDMYPDGGGMSYDESPKLPGPGDPEFEHRWDDVPQELIDQAAGLVYE